MVPEPLTKSRQLKNPATGINRDGTNTRMDQCSMRIPVCLVLAEFSTTDKPCCHYLSLSIDQFRMHQSNTRDDIRWPILIHRSGLNLRRMVIDDNLVNALGRRQEKRLTVRMQVPLEAKGSSNGQKFGF